MRWVCPACGQSAVGGGTCAHDGATLARADDPLLGIQLGNFRVARLLGSGGMGRVYLAVHATIGSRVAIKVLQREAAEDRDLVERFFAEARAVNVIRHESIVDIIDMATLPDGRPYIVMEYLAGNSLRALVERGPMPLGTVAHLAIEVLDALGAAHAKGICHRDLKPDNIMITPGGRAKVLDFGIAKLTGRGRSPTPTRSNQVVGTPEYMAPEQASGNVVDGRTDLYALGIILFEAVTGQRPFQSSGLFELLRQQVEDPPPSPRDLRPELPEDYEAIILRALAKDPDARYDWAKDMASELARVAEDLPRDEFERVSLDETATGLRATTDFDDLTEVENPKRIPDVLPTAVGVHARDGDPPWSPRDPPPPAPTRASRPGARRPPSQNDSDGPDDSADSADGADSADSDDTPTRHEQPKRRRSIALVGGAIAVVAAAGAALAIVLKAASAPPPQQAAAPAQLAPAVVDAALAIAVDVAIAMVAVDAQRAGDPLADADIVQGVDATVIASVPAEDASLAKPPRLRDGGVALRPPLDASVAGISTTTPAVDAGQPIASEATGSNAGSGSADPKPLATMPLPATATTYRALLDLGRNLARQHFNADFEPIVLMMGMSERDELDVKATTFIYRSPSRATGCAVSVVFTNSTVAMWPAPVTMCTTPVFEPKCTLAQLRERATERGLKPGAASITGSFGKWALQSGSSTATFDNDCSRKTTAAKPPDAANFDPDAYAAIAQKLARDSMEDAILIGYRASGVTRHGIANLTLSPHFTATYTYRSPARSSRVTPGMTSPCLTWITVTAQGVQTYPAQSPSCKEPAIPRRCSLKKLWSRAIEAGAPTDGVAEIEWENGAWEFQIHGTFEKDFPDDC